MSSLIRSSLSIFNASLRGVLDGDHIFLVNFCTIYFVLVMVWMVLQNKVEGCSMPSHVASEGLELEPDLKGEID